MNRVKNKTKRDFLNKYSGNLSSYYVSNLVRNKIKRLIRGGDDFF